MLCLVHVVCYIMTPVSIAAVGDSTRCIYLAVGKTLTQMSLKHKADCCIVKDSLAGFAAFGKCSVPSSNCC
jgi:hypothetical protein